MPNTATKKSVSPFEPPKKPPPKRFVHEFGGEVVKGFLARVYAFVILEFLLIMAMIQWATPSETLFDPNSDLPTIHSNVWVLIVAIVIAAVLLLIMSCSTRITQLYPVNLVLLLVYLVSLAYLVAAVGPDSTLRQVVLHAMGICTLLVLLLFLYTLQPWGGYSFVVASIFCVLVLVLAGIVLILADPSEYAWNWHWLGDETLAWQQDSVYTSAGVWLGLAGALIFSCYLQYVLYTCCSDKEPHRYIEAAFFLNTAVIAWLAFLLIGLAATVGKATAVVSSILNARVRFR